MKIQTILLSLVFIPMLAACGGAFGSEGLCKANVEEQLLNPETLKMLDFQPVSKEGYAAIMARNFLDAQGGNFEYVSEEMQLQMFTQAVLKELKKDVETNPKIKLFSARIRAEGPTGNTITKAAACLAVDDACKCEF